MLDLARVSELVRLFEAMRLRKKPPRPRPRGSTSESALDIVDIDDSGRGSSSICEIIEARFEAGEVPFVDGFAGTMPSNERKVRAELACGSVRMISSRRHGAGLHGLVGGGRDLCCSAFSRRYR